MSPEVGDRTALVDSGRHPPRRRRVALPWLLWAITFVAGALGAWLLWEHARLAQDEAADARARLDAAHRRAADVEAQLLGLTAGALRAGAPPAAGELDTIRGGAAARHRRAPRRRRRGRRGERPRRRDAPRPRAVPRRRRRAVAARRRADRRDRRRAR